MIGDALKAATIKNGKITAPILLVVGALAVGAYYYLDARFDRLERMSETLSCFHLKAEEARALANCPGSPK